MLKNLMRKPLLLRILILVLVLELFVVDEDMGIGKLTQELNRMTEQEQCN
jgi:hypothetical protein